MFILRRRRMRSKSEDKQKTKKLEEILVKQKLVKHEDRITGGVAM